MTNFDHFRPYLANFGQFWPKFISILSKKSQNTNKYSKRSSNYLENCPNFIRNHQKPLKNGHFWPFLTIFALKLTYLDVNDLNMDSGNRKMTKFHIFMVEMSKKVIF